MDDNEKQSENYSPKRDEVVELRDELAKVCGDAAGICEAFEKVFGSEEEELQLLRSGESLRVGETPKEEHADSEERRQRYLQQG